MAKLCFSNQRGTFLHGLYRGLRIKTKESEWKVSVQNATLEELRTQFNFPVILRVSLTAKVAKKDIRYTRDWGWVIGEHHSVVFFGFKPNNLVEIGDPSVGRENWFLQNVIDLWTGEVVSLVQKK